MNNKRRCEQQEVFSGRCVELDGDSNDEENGKNERCIQNGRYKKHGRTQRKGVKRMEEEDKSLCKQNRG